MHIFLFTILAFLFTEILLGLIPSNNYNGITRGKLVSALNKFPRHADNLRLISQTNCSVSLSTRLSQGFHEALDFIQELGFVPFSYFPARSPSAAVGAAPGSLMTYAAKSFPNAIPSVSYVQTQQYPTPLQSSQGTSYNIIGPVQRTLHYVNSPPIGPVQRTLHYVNSPPLSQFVALHPYVPLPYMYTHVYKN